MASAADLTTIAATRGAPLRPPVATGQRPGRARPTRPDQVERLSAMLTYLRHMQDQEGADRRLDHQFDDLTRRLEALIDALSSPTLVEPSRPDPAAIAPETRGELNELETAFVRWLADPIDADELRVDDAGRSPRALSGALDELCRSQRPLPTEVAAAFGMPVGTTIGHAARELWHAVEDPRGPRCGTHRAGVYFLRGIDRPAPLQAANDRTRP